jgi:hypothetical protein
VSKLIAHTKANEVGMAIIELTLENAVFDLSFFYITAFHIEKGVRKVYRQGVSVIAETEIK